MEFAPTNVRPTGSGASGELRNSFDEEPMCRQMGKPVAVIAAHSGSQ